MFKYLKFELKVSLVYLIIGCSWIVFSDKLLYYFFHDNVNLSTLQTYKGWFYVGVTTLFLYVFLRNHLKKLREIEMKASENDRLKTAFIRHISHEIRTPIHGISGFSELLQHNDSTMDEKMKYIRIIERSAHELLSVTNGMMDLSLIEVGAVTVNKKLFNVNILLEELFLRYLGVTNENVNLKLEHTLPNGLKHIFCDEAKIKLVMGNLIQNACKFTNQGFVKFGCYYENGLLVFFVKDTGLGLTLSEQKLVFKSFNKLTNETRGHKSGMGLGLSISQSIVNILGGDIWLSSIPDEGTTIYFSLKYSDVVMNKLICNTRNN